jgi:HD-GYP domain-containing protein (c-di-GMP phosphodiesterase class II)
VPAVTTDHRPSPLGSIAGASVIDAPTGALDRFVQALRDGRRVPRPYLTALSAIQEGTEADLVFLCPDQEGQILEIIGGYLPTPQWCQRVARWLSGGLPRGGVWKGPEAGGEPRPCLPDGPEPAAAVVYPVEAPRPAWLVVLRFGEDRPFVASDLRLVRMVWQLQTDKKRHDHIYDNLKETLFGVVRCLSTAIDAKDPYTCGHSERVARIAVRLGKEMRLSSGEISDLYLAGLLHDVGKIGIRDEVLCKPGPLTPEEFAHMREHPVIGERIIANVSRLSYIRPGVRGHHERFDGKGYPDGIAGEAIPLMARILAVSDSCDAMMSARRYRPELSQARIEQIFKEGNGTQWDPRIVEYFFSCRHDLYAVFQRGLGQSVYTAVERAAGDDSPESRRVRLINRSLSALEGN